MFALLMGLGGGFIRDMLLGNLPATSLRDPWSLATVLVAVGIVLVIGHHLAKAATVMSFLDGLALGLFAVTGTEYGLAFGLPYVSAILLGAISAVGGGMLVSVLQGQTPEILLAGAPTALLAVAGSLTYAVLSLWSPSVASVVGIAVVVAGQYASRRLGIRTRPTGVHGAVGRVQQRGRVPRRHRGEAYTWHSRSLSAKRSSDPVVPGGAHARGAAARGPSRHRRGLRVHHEPVGSKALVERHNLGVSPATIRNDMAALEDEGYIAQPHTSAGRVPTDNGYRLFVDRLSAVKPLSARRAPGHPHSSSTRPSTSTTSCRAPCGCSRSSPARSRWCSTRRCSAQRAARRDRVAQHRPG